MWLYELTQMKETAYAYVCSLPLQNLHYELSNDTLYDILSSVQCCLRLIQNILSYRVKWHKKWTWIFFKLHVCMHSVKWERLCMHMYAATFWKVHTLSFHLTSCMTGSFKVKVKKIFVKNGKNWKIWKKKKLKFFRQKGYFSDFSSWPWP